MLLMLIAMLTACVSGGDASVALPEETVSGARGGAVPDTVPTPSPIVIDIPAPDSSEDGFGLGGALAVPEVLPLEALAPGAIDYVAGRLGRIGVAVAVPDDGAVYVLRGDEQFPLASVAKVPIMLATLNEIDEAGRAPNDYEEELLRQMITVSDNIDAYSLWDAVGGADAVARYLNSIEIEGLTLDPTFWGESLAEAGALAGLLVGLVEGAVLSESSTDLALALLEGVDEAQDWGVPYAAVTDEAVEAIGVKNGWYPTEDGWRVNSVGYVVSEGGHLEYTMAVLTDQQSSLEYGVSTIEGLSDILHGALAAKG